jgi:hypothetical protein
MSLTDSTMIIVRIKTYKDGCSLADIRIISYYSGAVKDLLKINEIKIIIDSISNV